MTDLDATQIERATGAFVLVIESQPATELEWRALRQALRLSRADDQWLRSRVPGVVRKGAREDLLPLLDRVLECGHRASIRGTLGGVKLRLVA